MPEYLTIRFATGDPALRREIEQGVEEYANVLHAQSYTDLETIKLVLEVVGQGVTIAGGVAGILTFVRSLQVEKKQQGSTVNIFIGVPGGPEVPIEDADADLLMRLLQDNVM